MRLFVIKVGRGRGKNIGRWRRSWVKKGIVKV